MHNLIVHCVDLGGGDVDGVHGAAESVGVDVVAHFERLEEQQHHSACEILQGAAQCHADSKASCSQKCRERAGGYSEYADDNYEENHRQRDVDKTYCECGEGRIDFPFGEYFAEKFLNAPYNPCSQ